MRSIEKFMPAPLLLLLLLLLRCSSPEAPDLFIQPKAAPVPPENILEQYPDYVTAVEDYYLTRISEVPELTEENYALTISGISAGDRVFTLPELQVLDMIEYPLTIQCVGNSPEDSLIGTAEWKGFRIYDFLSAMGMTDFVGGVRYNAADGYYASHTLGQLRDNNVIAALFMNGEALTPVQGFPLRMINPGYHGVKQPAWITSIEVLSVGELAAEFQDFWAPLGYDVEAAIPATCKFFFPSSPAVIQAGDVLSMGGAGYGGRRIDRVEVTADRGDTWRNTAVVQSTDADHVWMFWYGEWIFPRPGNYTVYARSIDVEGNVQPVNFLEYGDALINIIVE